ncbi:hypothetical protein D3C86_2102720 [compost metagenome]
MIVGHHEAAGGHNHAGAKRRLFFRAVRHLLAEELLEERIAGKGRQTPLHDALGIDIHDSACGALDQRRKGKLHFRVA